MAGGENRRIYPAINHAPGKICACSKMREAQAIDFRRHQQVCISSAFLAVCC
jgi:hypothetical protein